MQIKLDFLLFNQLKCFLFFYNVLYDDFLNGSKRVETESMRMRRIQGNKIKKMISEG